MKGVPPLLVALATCQDDQVPDLAGSVPEEEWPNLLDTVRRHGLTPLLAHLLRLRPTVVPRSLRDTLRAHEEHAMLWQKIRMADLKEAAAALAEGGIPMLVLKGAAMGPMLYERPWHRLAGDTDILVPAGQAERAHALISARGFDVTEEWADSHHLPALQKSNHPPLEIHHESLYIPTPDPGYTVVPTAFDRLYDAGSDVRVDGVSVRVPGRADAFLQLSCNFASHMEESVARPFRWVRDYSELMRQGLMWPEVRNRLAELAPELTETVLLCLAIARPFLEDFYDEELTADLSQLRPGLKRMAAAITPEQMVHEWHTGPRRALKLLSCMMGPWRASAWAARKLLVSRTHISRQTGIPSTSLSMRVYPVAFAIHAAYHIGRRSVSERSAGTRKET